MTTLTISHNCWLSREERCNLLNGKIIETIGTSIPVWFYKGNTSEPAPEVFCIYVLSNKGSEPTLDMTDEGYKINIPCKSPLINDEALLEDKGCLQYKYFNKLKKDNKMINIVHIIEIKSKESLMETLSTVR